MRAAPGLITFNNGELGRALEGRVDLKQYPGGCYALEGFIPRVQGPARRSPGTVFTKEVKTSANRTAISEFIKSTTESFILEWGNLYLRFYQNHAIVESSPGVAYEIASPYATADLFDASGFFQLVFVQSADVIYIVHRSKTFPIYKLSHFGTTNWTIAAMTSIGGPFADANPGTNPVVYASAETGTGITLTASSDIFAASIMGAYFQLTEQNIRDVRPWESGKQVTKGDRRRYNGVTYEAMNGTDPTTLLPKTGTIPPTHITGQAHDGGGPAGGILWEYRDPGYGFVQLKTKGAAPSGGSVAITGITAAKPPVVTTGSVTAAVNGDTVFITGVKGMTEVNDKFFVVNNKVGSTFELQQVPDGGGAVADVDGTNWAAYTNGGTVDNRLWTATADVIEQLAAGTVNRLPATTVGSQNATSIWAVGAWNARDGYPSAVAFFRGRLVFQRDGQQWHSVSQDFENFSALTPNALVTADMAISITMPTQNAVDWLVSGRALIAGMEADEHSVQEINQGQAFGPANVATREQLHEGSRPVRPVTTGKTLLWTQTSGLEVLGMQYDFGSDNYDVTNFNALHDTIASSGIVGMAFQKRPDYVVWAICADGRLIGLVYNEKQSVTAWLRRPMVADAVVESIACIPNPNRSQDDLWMVVRRTINGVTKRYVEYLDKHFQTGDSIVTGATYGDSRATYSGAPTRAPSGFGHLEGRTVKVAADGMWHRDCVVTGGAIALDFTASVVNVGLRQQAKLTTMPLEPGYPNGTAQTRAKRITSVAFRFLNTLGGYAGRDSDVDGITDKLEFRNPEDPMNQQVPVYSGIWPPNRDRFLWSAGTEVEGRLTYINDTMFPATIVGIYPDLEVMN